MNPAQQMRAAAERLLEQARNFEDGDLWDGYALDLAVAVLANVEPA